jgi:hypothetical protein
MAIAGQTDVYTRGSYDQDRGMVDAGVLSFLSTDKCSCCHRLLLCHDDAVLSLCFPESWQVGKKA